MIRQLLDILSLVSLDIGQRATIGRTVNLPPFLLKLRDNVFSRSELAQALHGMSHALRTFDWKSIGLNANPLVNPMEYLSALATQVPRSPKAEGWRTVYAFSRRYLETLSAEVRRFGGGANAVKCRPLTAALDQLSRALDRAMHWKEDDLVYSVTYMLPVSGVREDIEQFDRALRQQLDPLRLGLEFDPSWNPALHEDVGAGAGIGTLEELPQLSLPYPIVGRAASRSVLVEALSFFHSNVQSLPANPLPGLAKEVYDFATRLPDEMKLVRTTEGFPSLRARVSRLNADLVGNRVRDISEANALMLSEAASRLDEALRSCEEHVEPNIDTLTFFLPFRAHHADFNRLGVALLRAVTSASMGEARRLAACYGWTIEENSEGLCISPPDHKTGSNRK